ncbi:sigma-54 dependent transcriptional regulator [Azospirillum sp. B4]|uniref:sigma-54-dependent transcriptional regulator n=1 Tax=Azospirillum sp. B4 TaxID=95605 RepID=UPI00034D384B|nr:sigma-54 dependent transcriptional regulator [Azospirillum sp. B4]
METRPRRVLIVEPTPSLAAAYGQALRKDGHALQVVDTAAATRRALAEMPADVVLLNLQLPGGSGLDLLKELKADAKAPQVVALTAQGSVQLAVDVMRAGAVDVLLLPAGTERLRQAMATALAEREKVLEAAPPTALVEDPLGYLGFVGISPAMRGVYRMIEAAAPSKATVFITGESGTGKEVCAEAIHRRSPRTGRPFIPVNCAAIPKDLMESEIFGHVKGAFTGATSDHAGAALQADGGTLFLDEIGEMDLALQAKLLRFLQTGMVKKVGSEKAEAVDVRIVCATNRDPFAEVQAGRFREDLFYRLQVISIELPPLRDRGDDILLIAREFLAKYTQEERKSFTGFSDEAEEIMRTYAWPGNVRQLLNVVRNVVVLNDGAVIQPFMLPPPLNKPTMIVPPMLNDPRWAAMAGPMPFPFTPPPAANLAGPAPLGVAPTGFGMPPAMPAPVPAPGGVSMGGARIPGMNAPAPNGWAAPIPLDEAPTAAGDLDPNPERRIRPLWMVEEETIEEAIRLCQGNITRAAALLEINPCTIYRRRQKKRATA